MAVYDDLSQIEASAKLITKGNVHELKENPRDYASRYLSIPVLSALEGNLDNMTRIAVVGTPCQLRSLSLLEGEKTSLKFFKIGIACSGGMSYKATEQYKFSKNMPKAKMYYRGHGWPGNNSLINKEQILDFPHLCSLFETMFSSQIFKNPGCRYCRDHFAEAANISFCDFWNEQEVKMESTGNSCVIVRNTEAMNIISTMKVEGYIEMVRELSETETINTQLALLKAKKGDLSGKMHYRLFMKFIDWIFKYKLYRFFGLKNYKLFAKFYWCIFRPVNSICTVI